MPLLAHGLVVQRALCLVHAAQTALDKSSPTNQACVVSNRRRIITGPPRYWRTRWPHDPQIAGAPSACMFGGLASAGNIAINDGSEPARRAAAVQGAIHPSEVFSSVNSLRFLAKCTDRSISSRPARTACGPSTPRPKSRTRHSRGRTANSRRGPVARILLHIIVFLSNRIA
jgi:hypothetical protein